MRDLYPGYDVLSKRDTPSWNGQTRGAIDRRLAIDPERYQFFSEAEWLTLCALCHRIIPQPTDRTPVPVAAMVDLKMVEGPRDGYRNAQLPPMQDAWRQGLAALDLEARGAHGRRFHELPAVLQEGLIIAMQNGDLHGKGWRGMPCHLFFKDRLLVDIVKSYYAHPTAWNEIGWGGPASPRGYVRLKADRRDPWEAAEAQPGREAEAYRENRRVGR